jgi:ribose transport system permease protein
MNGNGQIVTDPTRSGLLVRIAGIADRGTWLPVGVFAALIAIFSFASPAFFTWRNFAATTGEAATLLIASLGATFVILMGSIDLSVGAVVLLVVTATVAGLKLVHAVDLCRWPFLLVPC